MYDFYEMDSAVFRRKADANLPGVQEVKSGDTWKPYTGDRLAPVTYGDKISPEQAGESPDEAKEKAEAA